MDNEEHHPHKSSSLHSPLFRHGEDDAPRASGSNDKAETGKVLCCCSVGKGGVFEEIKKQLWLAVPLISVNLLLYCIQIVSMIFVGHLGELALLGASMATSFASVTGYSLLNQAMESEENHQRQRTSPSLHSPLIQQDEDGDGDGDDRETSGLNPKAVRETGRRKEVVFEEIKKQLWLAGPLISVNLLQYCLLMISLMFVGHLGDLPLSGASMATSFASVTGFYLLGGMASALETFCGQSYGAKQYHMLGVHTQRAMAVLLLVSVPLAVVWANTRTILVAVGQDPDIAREAGTYAKYMIPSLFAYGILQCLVKFLQTQSIVFPMMISSGISTLLHILACWGLIFKSGIGFRGAAVANSISNWLNVLFLAVYVKFSPSCSKTWTGFTKEALHDVLTFIRLAIPSAIMVCLEMWSFEMVVLLSGLLPNPTLETSVLSISLNTALTVWMIPMGLSGAVSTRVSNELGAGKPQAALLAVRIVLGMVVTEGILVGTVLILVRNIWGYAYSNDKEVVRYVGVMMPILAVSCFLDGFQCVLSGIARGCGWQKIGAYVNLGSYYIIGVPSAVLLAFVLHVGGKGLWFGIICALIVQMFSLLLITIRTNWDQEAKKATARVYDSIVPVEGLP